MSNRFVVRLVSVVAVIGLLVAVVYAANSASRRRWVDRPGASRRVLVSPFVSTGAIPGWSPTTFADSLAAQLNANTSVDAHVGLAPAAEADFVVGGELSTSDGRVVFVVRLTPAGQRTPTWSATFWRDNLIDPKFAGDLAQRLLEALGMPLPQKDPVKTNNPKTEADREPHP